MLIGCCTIYMLNILKLNLDPCAFALEVGWTPLRSFYIPWNFSQLDVGTSGIQTVRTLS